jgi:hypothetical protein
MLMLPVRTYYEERGRLIGEFASVAPPPIADKP